MYRAWYSCTDGTDYTVDCRGMSVVRVIPLPILYLVTACSYLSTYRVIVNVTPATYSSCEGPLITVEAMLEACAPEPRTQEP